jgi:hypothetical protein
MATTPYLTALEFKAITLAPASYVDAVEAAAAGWTLARLVQRSAWINARLAKRYAAPFASPYPEAVTDWLCRIVTWELYLKRGVDPTDLEVAEIKKAADDAAAEVKEAAESREGLFELPLRADTSADGVARGSVQAYTEASPYTWSGVQRETALDELE